MRSHYLDDFVRQEVVMGAELVNGSELERALALLITRHRRAGYRHSRAARIQFDKACCCRVIDTSGAYGNVPSVSCTPRALVAREVSRAPACKHREGA